MIQPVRLLELLREAVPALAGQGAQDAIECLEAFASLREVRSPALIFSRKRIACPYPLGVVDAAALGLRVRR